MMRWLASRSASFWFVLRPSAAPTVLHWQSWLPARVSTTEASKKEGEAKLVPWMRCRCQKVGWKKKESISGGSTCELGGVRMLVIVMARQYKN